MLLGIVLMVIGVVGFVALSFCAIGIYEFYVETKQQESSRKLHLKHLDHINGEH